MGLVAKDVRWAVNAADREAAPWFQVYQGKRSLPDFFAELLKLTFSDFTLRSMLTDGDLVITWLHVAFTSPKGRAVDMEEVQIWQLSEGKVQSVDTLLEPLPWVPPSADRPGRGGAGPRLPHPARGAERVVLSLAAAFPEAPVYTSLYEPAGTFPEFSGLEIRTLPLNRAGVLRAHHRLALPLLAPAFSHLTVDADVTICSSSGWSHGARVTGRKIVYCYTPARWLYQADRYLDGSSRWSAATLSLLAPPLRRWDRRAAASADRYLVISHAVRSRVADLYGIDADVVYPPVDLDTAGPAEPVPGLEPGFLLCVSRLLPYKNVEAVTAGFRLLPDQRLVVVGSGPLSDQVIASAPANVTVLGRVTDANLRWLYASSRGLVAASYEDFGLTPVEATTFGKPTAALRWGGFLDTTEEGKTGVFFDEPEPRQIADAVSRLVEAEWSSGPLVEHARQFSNDRFMTRMHEVVAEERRAS